MMRKLTLVVCCAVVVLFGLLPKSGIAETPVGVAVEWIADGDGSRGGTLELQWTRGADEATVALRGPEKLSSPPWALEVLKPGSFKGSFGAVLPGDSVSLPLDLEALSVGERLVVAAQRRVGDIAQQTVVELRVQGDGVVLSRPRSYSITRELIADQAPPEPKSVSGATTSGSGQRGRVVIRPLDPKVQASVFGEDTDVYNIPDGPGNCADSGGDYPIDPIMSMDAAPPGSIITGLEVHVVISHTNLSQLHVAFSEDDYYWTQGGGLYLWRGDGGNGLDEVFTEDKYGNDLPGIGLEVNGWFSLWVRDCEAGVTGTLDYWSVTAEFDGGPELDLVAETLTVTPDPVEPGGQAELTWQGHIDGTDPISGPFDVGFYISPDATVTTADTELDRVTINNATDPGDVFGNSGPGHTVTIPGGLADGTWYIGAVLDPDDVHEEVNEDNNVASDSIGIAAAADLDLIADALTPALTSVGAGDTLAVTWSGYFAADSSEGIPGDVSVGFYLSPDATVTTADQLLQRIAIPGPLAPGDSFGEAARQLQIPGGTAAGAWTLGVIVDDTASVDERDENNNLQTAAITITNADNRPDLEIQNCAVSVSQVNAGGQVGVSWQRRNAGQSDSPGVHIGVYLSTDTTFDAGGDVELESWQTASWPAGGAWSPGSVNVTIPGGTANGSWFILVVLDGQDVIDELDENDNTCASALTVGSGGGGSVVYLIPAGASATGFNNSDWRTQISVANSTNAARTATVHYVPDGVAWPGQVLSGPFQVPSLSSYFVDDLLVALRPTTGLLYVELDAAGPVVTSRTYNRQANGSTFGQGIPAIPLVTGAAPQELVLAMVHSMSGQFHSNLGIIQASAGSITVQIQLYSADGALLASGTRTVNDAWEQINDVFSVMGAGGFNVFGAWARVSLVSGSPDAWACYASVVDKVTGDPTYVIGVEPQ